MKHLILSLLLLFLFAGVVQGTFVVKLEQQAPPSSVAAAADASPAAAPPAGAPPAAAGDQSTLAPSRPSAACESVKAEGCALCDHLVDPIAGCGLTSTSLLFEAVNRAIAPDIGVYSVVVSADGKTCAVEADMANEGGSGGECRMLGGMAYAVAKCPVGRIPTGVACVAISDDDAESTPVRGTTHATLLHTATCGFPQPFPPPFGGARAAIFMGCQNVELSASELMKKRDGPVAARPSVEELLRKAGKGPAAAKARAEARAEAVRDQQQQQLAQAPKVAKVETVRVVPAPVVVRVAAAPKAPRAAAGAAAKATTAASG